MDENVKQPQREFGQLPSTIPTAEDRIVARILAALGHSQPAATAQPVSEMSAEDQRLIGALSRAHPSGRNVIISNREEIANNLYFVEYGYTPAAGTPVEVKSLVYDNGTDKTHVFGGI